VLVKIDGVELTGSFQETGNATSPHSGRQLVVGQIQFVVRDPDQQKNIAASFSRRSAIDAVEGDRSLQFRILSSQYSSAGEGPPWKHAIEVEEAENLTPTEIVLDRLPLRPHTYEETVEDGGGILITARVLVDADTRQELEKKLEANHPPPYSYFDVVRTGLQPEARRMRFGRCFWSEHGADTKYRLTLVEKAFDDSEPADLNLFPELPNMRREVALAHNLISGLLESLVQSGTLSVEGRSAIEEHAQAGLWRRQWSLSKVPDIDKV